MAITIDVTPKNTTISPTEGVTTTLDITTSIPTISSFRPLINAIDAGGDGSLTYNSSDGNFTYTGPSATEVRAHLSAGTGVSYSSGQFSIGQDVATNATPTFTSTTVAQSNILNGASPYLNFYNAKNSASSPALTTLSTEFTGVIPFYGVAIDTDNSNAESYKPSGRIFAKFTDCTESALAGQMVFEVTKAGATGWSMGTPNPKNVMVLDPGTVTIGVAGTSNALDLTDLVVNGSLDINGNADISGNLTGVDTLTATNLVGTLATANRNEIFSNVSGDIAIAAGGAATIQPDSVELNVDTTGQYIRNIVTGGGVGIEISNSTDGDARSVTLENNWSNLPNYSTSLSRALADNQYVVMGVGTNGDSPFKTTLSAFQDETYSNVSGDITIAAGGAATIQATSVENSMLAGSITNAKLSNSTITVSDGSNTSPVALGGTLSFTGTSNEVTVAENAGTVTIGLPDDVTIAGDLSVADAPTAGAHVTNKTYVDAKVAALVDSAPAALDTLNELAVALGNDASYATTTASTIGGKLAKASNLSDLVDTGTARTNLGLGTAATTAATAYAPAAGSTDITTVGTIGTGVWQGTAIADTYISSAVTWNAKQAPLSFGIADTNSIVVDGTPVDGEFAQFTSAGLVSRTDAEVLSDIGAQGALTFGKVSGNALKSEEALVTNDVLLMGTTNVKGRTYGELKTDLSLDNVENSAISTFAGSSNIITTGALNTGSITSGFTSIDIGSGALTAGATTVNGELTVNSDTLKLTSATASSTVEHPSLELYRNGGVGSGDLGAIRFFGNNNATTDGVSTPEKFQYAGIYASVQSGVDGAEQGSLAFSLGHSGAQEDPAMSLFSYGLQMGYGNPILMSYSNGYQQFFSPDAAQKSFKLNATPNATVANGAYDIYLPDVAGGTLAVIDSDKAFTAGATTVNGTLSVNSASQDDTYSPEILLERNGGAAAGDDGDKLGVITFKGDDTSGTQAVYAQIGARIVDDGADNANTKGEIRIACGYNSNAVTLEDPSLRIDHLGTWINETQIDGAPSNTSFYNVSSGGTSGIKYWANASSGYGIEVKSATPTADRDIKFPDVSGFVVVSGVAGGSMNGGGGLGTAQTAWSPEQFMANANTDYYHYTPSGTDVDLVVAVPYSGIDLGEFGAKYTFRNISADSGSKITIDLDGFTSAASQGNPQYYSINKYDGSAPSLITSASANLVISAGGVIEMSPIAASVWHVTGTGFA